MALPIALQLYTVRDPLKDNLAATCRQVAQIGYTHAEIGPFGHTTEEVAAACQEAGLTPVASHEMALADDAKAAETVKLAGRLGMKYVVQPWLGEQHRTADGYRQTAERLAALSAGGVTVCYHNHDFEFQKLPDGRTGWQAMFDGTGLHAEMDTCWVAVGGEDPVAWINRLSGRVPLLHIKDCRDFQKKTLCEVGTGKVDIPAIVKAGPAAGATCYVVEQDNNWVDGDSLKSATISFQNLKKILA